MIGKPILGRIENLPNIRREMIVDFHNKNYVGENIIVLGVGDIPNHNVFMEMVHKHFSAYPAKSEVHQRIKPKFHPGISLVKPDLLENPPDGINVGVFFDAATWKDQDYYAFLILQRLIGDKPQHELEAKIFMTDASTNIFQNKLAAYNNILFQQSLYTPYMDCGLFGTFFYGDVASFEDMMDLTKWIFEKYAKGEITDVELDRAKNKLFIEILQHETGNDLSQAYGNQLLYLKRRVHRSEIAKRIANFRKEDVALAVEKWLLNKPYSVTAWGNVEELEKKYRISARSSITK